jgi:uncharacterized protein (TIGR03437 family)
LLTLFGIGLGPESLAVHDGATGVVPNSLGGTRVLFDGIPAPILASVSTQVNLVVPEGLAGRDAVRMAVEVNGNVIATFLMSPTKYRPAILGIFSPAPSDRFTVPADAYNEDGTRNSWENAAAYKSVVEFFATGVGPLEDPAADGAVAGGRRPAASVRVWIGDVESEVVEAATVEGRTNAVIRVRARVPDVCCGGNLRIRLAVNGLSSDINGPIVVVR